MDAERIRDRADALPCQPGVYQFLDGDSTVYVGKAVDLRDRVRSYADAADPGSASHDGAGGPRSERIREMVARSDAIEVSVTETEAQALLLEANLIKRYRPRYNVRLKDDKSYPLVQLTDHSAPRIEITRDPADDATVYGPFTDKGRLETVVKAVRETYGVRGCSDHKYANRDRPCLDYEMGLCTAPCTGEIDAESYREDVTATERFFEGETGVLADPIRREMERAADTEQFERAANLRDRLGAVESIHGEGEAAVSSPDAERTVDVLGVSVGGETATVARLHAEGGKLIERDRHEMAGSGREPADVLAAFVPQYYAERELPDALLLPEPHGDEELAAWLDGEGVAVRVPGAGREATLVDLALKNARTASASVDESAALADRLGLDDAGRIEGFDVSHAGGRAVVGSDVTVVDGTAETSDYRRKKLPEDNDDYASMRALVEWRAERAIEGRDDRPDPDLLVVDGGEGQLTAAREALSDVGWTVPVVALAKEEEVVHTPDGRHDWDDDAPALRLLRRVRDEAHRFAVRYHRSVRDEVGTSLDNVDGVGPETRRRLLRRFGSVDGVRTASRDELLDVDGVGERTADALERGL